MGGKFHLKLNIGVACILGAASALKQGEMFLQEQINLATETNTTVKADADAIGSGNCQGFFGDNVYDLKKFDEESRNMAKHIASVAPTSNANSQSSVFIYKACQNDFKLAASLDFTNTTLTDTLGGTWKPTPTITECANKGNAFIAEVDEAGQALTCKYSFMNSLLTPWEDNANNSTGWNLVWTSQETCGTDQKYVVDVEATCNESIESGALKIIGTAGQDKTCATSYTYEGKQGCVALKLPLSVIMKALGPYFGFICIAFGALMTYAGAKFLFVAISFMVASGVSAFSFMLIFNLFVPVNASAGVAGFLLFACIVLGGVVTYLTYKVTTKAAVPVIAGFCGLFLLWTLYGLTGLRIKVVRALFCVAGFALGAFLGHKAQAYVKTIGTAFIGANIIILGVSMYAGNIDMPNSTNPKEVPKAIWAYFAGWIVLFISGSVVQWKMFGGENEKEDAFNDEDEAKRCGCF